MVITELQDRNEAQAFLNALRRVSGGKATERPYAAHLLFLVTGLELKQASFLLENLAEIDKVTGPYVACHVFVDYLKVRTYERLVGIGRERHAREPELTLRQIEGLCNKNTLNHIELEDLAPSNLTSSTEYIARSLGIVEQVPCVVVMDACEMTSPGELTIIPFPSDGGELSQLIRPIVGVITSQEGKFRAQADVLEHIHELFDRRARLRTDRGAPIAHKIRTLKPILTALSDDPQKGLRDLQRVRTLMGEGFIFTDKQAKCINLLGQRSLLELEAKGRLFEDVGNQLRHSIKEEFGVEREFNGDAKACDLLTSLQELRESVIMNILNRTECADAEYGAAINDCEEEIRAQRQFLCNDVSLSQLLRNTARRAVVKTATKEMGAILRSGLGDLGKPSFWLKIFGL